MFAFILLEVPPHPSRPPRPVSGVQGVLGSDQGSAVVVEQEIMDLCVSG